MKYKIGDKVRVREDLQEYNYYGEALFNPHMKDYKGEVDYVREIDEKMGIYYLQNGKSWSFTDEMLELVEDRDPTYTTLDMIKKLYENPRRVAELIGNSVFSVRKWCSVMVNARGVIVWDNYVPFEICVEDGLLWKIIEPPKKLKEMSFGEANWWYANTDVFSYDVRSVLTGKALLKGLKYITKEEFMGLWTVEGVYEESEGK